jgi:hypothetical protein
MARSAAMALACAGLLLCAPSAHAAGTSTGENIVLDSHSLTGAPRAESQTVLNRGAWYVIRVEGTVSFYSPAQWLAAGSGPNAHVVCGTPEAAPMYGGLAAPVGVDSEFVFARPALARRCNSPKLPSRWTNFRIGVTTDPDDFVNQTAVTGPAARVAGPHVYYYTVQGHNRTARFLLHDTPASDNYGELHINVRPAVTLDCVAFSPQAFGTSTVKACTKAI